MSSDRHTIIYTHTDEAPALATQVAAAGRQRLHPRRRRAGRAARHLPRRAGSWPPSPSASPPSSGSTTTSPSWASWCTRPEANVIKLPNVSASIPQLKATIEELRGKGYALPDYPDEPVDPRGAATIQARYDKVKGSAVNPVLREGNSDRRAPASVKNYARIAPAQDGRVGDATRRPTSSTMGHDDFRSNEQSVTFAAADDLKVELVGERRHRHRAEGVDPGARR